jgi:hypothetical protein
LKPDLLGKLQRDLAKIGKQPRPIFLSFIGDPFERPGTETTRAVLDAIWLSGNHVRLLTKQWMPSYFLSDDQAEVGVTLTCRDTKESLTWEPGTLLSEYRINNLVRSTDPEMVRWASFEPVINPDWTLELMERAAPYCDVFAIGCFNHLGNVDWPSPEEEARVRGIDWRKFLFEAQAFANQLGKTAYYKADLQKAAGVGLWAEFPSLDHAINAFRSNRAGKEKSDD